MTDTTKIAARPSIIETATGHVPVAGSHEEASQAVYETEEAAQAALRKALEGCIAVCKRYGMHGLVVVGARHTDSRAVNIAAGVHGDGQFIGTAMAQLQSLPGWQEAAAFERGQRAETSGEPSA